MVVPKWKSRSCRVFVTGRYLMVRPTCASTVIINTATIERRNSAVRAIPLIFQLRRQFLTQQRSNLDCRQERGEFYVSQDAWERA